MLNLKKGLAVVLAAATALTFAPIANLGTAIDASAKTIADGDYTSINLVAGEKSTITIKDLTKISPKPANGAVVTATVSNESVAAITADSTTNGTTKVAAGTDGKVIGGTGANKDDYKQLTNFTTGGTVIVDGVAQGDTTLTLAILDSNNQPTVSETIAIHVSAQMQYINLSASELDGNKVGDNTYLVAGKTTDAEADRTITIDKIGNQAEDTTKDFYLEYKSGNTNVADVASQTPTSGTKLTYDTTDSTYGSAASKKASFVVSFKGVGEATITVNLYSTDAGAQTHKKLVAQNYLTVKVADKTDTLSVSYDGNRDGKDDGVKLTTTINEQVAKYSSYKADGTINAATTTAGTGTDGTVYELATDNGGTVTGSNTVRVLSKTSNDNPYIFLDSKTNPTAKITASDSLGRQITFSSNRSSIVVDNAGNISIDDTALAHDNTAGAAITISVPQQGKGNDTIAALSVVVPVSVAVKDRVTLAVKNPSSQAVLAKTVGGSNINKNSTIDDLPTVYLSTKDKKTLNLAYESNVGANFIQGAVYNNISGGAEDNKSTDVVSYANGTLTALKAGDAVLKVTARNDGNTYGDAAIYLHVAVVTKNANNVITANPSTINLTAANKTATISAKSTYPTTLKYELVKELGSSDAATSSNVSVNGVTGEVSYTSTDTGVAYVKVSGYETNDAVAPDAAWVTVNYSSTKAASDLSVSTKELNLKPSETGKIVASGSSITYKSSNEDVATVAADGTVTAKKAGVAIVTVSSPETAEKLAGTEYVTVIVSQEGEVDDTTKPAKVTGVKVKNKKGGFVTVTWTKQSQKNVKYYVKKTVGKKSSGKSVNGKKTTLQVKKGATVKVKVKAYVYNKAGDKLVGSYSKTVTFKTDKK